MRFATRTFLWSFVPFVVLLLGSFWAIQKLVEHTVRDGLRSSLRQTHVSLARTLKAGLQLLLAAPRNGDARRTVEDQPREICERLGFDFLPVSNPDAVALAGVMRVGEQLVGMDIARLRPPQQGFGTVGERSYQVVSTPIDQGDENIGILSVGEPFDFSAFTTPAILAHRGKVAETRGDVPARGQHPAGLGVPDTRQCVRRPPGV